MEDHRLTLIVLAGLGIVLKYHFDKGLECADWFNLIYTSALKLAVWNQGAPVLGQQEPGEPGKSAVAKPDCAGALVL